MKCILKKIVKYIKRIFSQKPERDNPVTHIQIDVVPESYASQKGSCDSIRDLIALCMEPFI